MASPAHVTRLKREENSRFEEKTLLAHRQWRTHVWTQGVKERKIERRGRGRKAKFEKNKREEERDGKRERDRKRESEREKREIAR